MSAKGSPPPSIYSCVCSVVVPKQKRLRSYQLLVLFQVSASETVFTEGYSVSILVVKVINFFLARKNSCEQDRDGFRSIFGLAESRKINRDSVS